MSTSGARAAFVTGASRGIGFSLSRALVADGYAVTMVARNREPLAAAAGELRQHGGTVEESVADFTDMAAVSAAIDQHRATFGRMDVLINNAGTGVIRPVDQLTDKLVNRQIDVNLRAIVVAYRDAASLLRAAGNEHGNALVINMSSYTAFQPDPEQAVYAATKAAVVSLTTSMNHELGPSGVKSTALCPGYVDTDMTTFLHERVPASDMLRSSDLVGAMRWLLSTSPQCVVPEINFARPGGKA